MKNITLTSILKGSSKVRSDIRTNNIDTNKLTISIVEYFFSIIEKVCQVNQDLMVLNTEDTQKDLHEIILRGQMTLTITYDAIIPNAVKSTIKAIKKLMLYHLLLKVHDYATRYPDYINIEKHDISLENFMYPNAIEEAMSKILVFLSNHGHDTLGIEIYSTLEVLFINLEESFLNICNSSYLRCVTDKTNLTASIVNYIMAYLKNPSYKLIYDFCKQLNEILGEIDEKIEKIEDDLDLDLDEIALPAELQEAIAQKSIFKL